METRTDPDSGSPSESRHPGRYYRQKPRKGGTRKATRKRKKREGHGINEEEIELKIKTPPLDSRHSSAL